MTKREMIIAPRLTLPMRPTFVETREMNVIEEETLPQPTRPMKRRKAPTRNLRQTLSIAVRELVFLLIAADMTNMAFWYLAPWPVYRIVAFVVIFILWSNFASSTTRVKTKQTFDMLNTMSTQAVHAVKRPRQQAAAVVKPEHNLDTTAYLIAIKKYHYASIQTGSLYDPLLDDHSYRDLLHRPESTPIR